MFVHPSEQGIKEGRPTKVLSTFERANMVVEENLVCVKLANSMDRGLEKELPPLVFDDLVALGGTTRVHNDSEGQPPPPEAVSTFERAYEVVENSNANLECKKPASPALANSMDSNDVVLSANVVSPYPGVRRGIPTLSSPSVPVTGPFPCLDSPSVPLTDPDLSRQKNRAEARLNSLYLGEGTTAAKARCNSYSVR
jgi:hypothetical protein